MIFDSIPEAWFSENLVLGVLFDLEFYFPLLYRWWNGDFFSVIFLREVAGYFSLGFRLRLRNYLSYLGATKLLVGRIQ